MRQCRERAAREGWTVVETYSDRAISGASMVRAGIQALLTDAQAGRFDIVLSEALDRLSRDQEDVAAVFNRLRFAGVSIVTLSEGEINELHVGLKGTMNALFLKDLALKTHRGQRGRVEAGKSGSGRAAYGYRVVHQLDADGEPIRGERAIVEAEAEIVRRIFRNYASGRSPKEIAFQLNREGVPGLHNRPWIDATTRGNPVAGTAILNNELYAGVLVWNRQRFTTRRGAFAAVAAAAVIWPFVFPERELNSPLSATWVYTLLIFFLLHGLAALGVAIVLLVTGLRTITRITIRPDGLNRSASSSSS